MNNTLFKEMKDELSYDTQNSHPNYNHPSYLNVTIVYRKFAVFRS